MKQLVKVEEVEAEGLIGLMGRNVTFYCAGFIYTGKLVGVNDSFVKLDPATIVYDTGSFANKEWTTKEEFPGAWYIQASSIESFGELK